MYGWGRTGIYLVRLLGQKNNRDKEETVREIELLEFMFPKPLESLRCQCAWEYKRKAPMVAARHRYEDEFVSWTLDTVWTYFKCLCTDNGSRDESTILASSWLWTSRTESAIVGFGPMFEFPNLRREKKAAMKGSKGIGIQASKPMEGEVLKRHLVGRWGKQISRRTRIVGVTCVSDHCNNMATSCRLLATIQPPRNLYDWIMGNATVHFRIALAWLKIEHKLTQ